MNKAINARMQGDDYQALFFWCHVLKMFHPNTCVEKVAYEADNIKSFDDIVVYYKKDKPKIDCRNKTINIDFFQVKFHVTNNNAITWDGLMSSKFINAPTVSIMQRLKAAKTKYVGDDIHFNLVSTWTIDSDDILGEIVSNDEYEIRMDKLFDNRKKSKMAKMRQKMIKHLGFSTDEELKNLLLTFRLQHSQNSIKSMIDTINRDLVHFGFKPIENNSIINPYVDIIKQWSKRGITEFTKDFIIKECKRENLYSSNCLSKSGYVDIGIRSFCRRVGNMKGETKKMLCLLQYFNKRYIKEGFSWNKNIFIEVNNFVENELSLNNKYRLHLDTHLSIAFIVGYLLDTKTGIEVYPIQKTDKGMKIWGNEEESNKVYSKWKINKITLSEDVQDIALVLGVTLNILDEVSQYIEEKEINISKIISCNVGCESGNNTIVDGTHAKILANSLSAILKDRSLHEKRKKLHIFSSCPAAFLFYLGQLSKSFGKVVLYEYEYENFSNQIYLPSFELPIKDDFRKL